MYKKALAAAAVALGIAVALVAGRAGASPTTYALKAALSGKATTGARGTLVGKLTVAGKKSAMLWTLRFNGLSGKATRAGIYFTKTKQLAMLLCLNCTSGAQSSYHGSYVASKPFVNAVTHGQAYVSIRTKKNPSGEIRGVLRVTS